MRDIGDGIIHGLALTYKETRLFPANLVSPQYAIGKRGPKHKTTYQLNVDICPYINEKNGCMIYDKRPLSCKSYPNEPYPFGNVVDVDCKSIGSQMKSGEYREVDMPQAEKVAGDKMMRYIWTRFRKYRKKGSKVWKFNLRTRKWMTTKPKKPDRLPFFNRLSK